MLLVRTRGVPFGSLTSISSSPSSRAPARVATDITGAVTAAASPCAMAEPRPQVALKSIWPSAVSLKPPPDALAETSGWISTAIAVSAGLSLLFSM